MAVKEVNIKKSEPMIFIRDCLPQLTAGKYTVDSNIELGALKGVEGTIVPSNKIFYVDGPRFTLLPSDIYNVYPPEEHTGFLESTLPHIVFKRRTLPWERTIDGKSHQNKEGKNPPWMALILLNESEIKENNIKIESRPIAQLLDPKIAFKDLEGVEYLKGEEDTIGPEIASFADNTSPCLMPWEDKKKGKPVPMDEKDMEMLRCNTIDLPTNLFLTVAPKLDDLPYLAHVRKVNVDENKERADNDDDGYFSVLICNRLPTRKVEMKKEAIKAKEDNGVKNTVFLVSLEGYHNYLKTPSSLKSEKVRLVVLHQWSFNVAKGTNFKELCEGLKDSARPLKMDHGTENISTELEKVYDYGYTALEHKLRSGGKTLSWYRGPLSPNFLPTEPKTRTFSNADNALRYDNENGLLDVSYAAAWQLGRLLALQDQEFSSSLHRWKVSYKQKEREVKFQNQLRSLLPSEEKVTNEDQLEDMVKNFLCEKYDPEYDSKGEINQKPVLFEVESEYQKTNWTQTSGEPLPVPKVVTSWLGRLFLLHGVPFNYLIAHEKILKEETLGTFYIDPSWIEALVDGALSIARSSDSEMLLNKVKDGQFLPEEVKDLKKEFEGLETDNFNRSKDDLNDLIDQIQNAELKVELEELSKDSNARELLQKISASIEIINPVALREKFKTLLLRLNTTQELGRIEGHITGFLLRSQLISGWKGIKVLAKGANGNWLPPLRIERIENDILLCIFRGKVANVIIIQSPENIHFGLMKEGDNWVKNQRDENGNLNENKHIMPFRNDSSSTDVNKGVLNINKIAENNKAIKNSADFAFQMIESPIIYTLAIND